MIGADYPDEGVGFVTRGKVVTSRWSDPAVRESGGLELAFPKNH